MNKVFLSLDDTVVVDLLNTGAVGVIPTDTVYGLVASVYNPDAVARLYRLKNRTRKPGTVIAASIDQLLELGLERKYIIADKQFWPGPVSVEIPHNINYLNQGTGRQAFRIPDDENLRRLLTLTGPLQTTSANLPDLVPANTVREAKTFFEDKVDFYVDGGDLSDHEPSTIIKVVDGKVEIIRMGSVAFTTDGKVL